MIAVAKLILANFMISSGKYPYQRRERKTLSSNWRMGVV
jgi:hypothetical protein